jgi:two-component system, sensor histidine kinase
MLYTKLTLEGHEVHAAADGPRGLEALQEHRPDVALIDVGLPGLDGYEVARRARAIVGPSIRLIALTGYGTPDDRARALAAGFDTHLVKPVHPEALTKALGVNKPPSPQSLGAMARIYDPVEDAVEQRRQARHLREQAQATRRDTQQLMCRSAARARHPLR